MSASKEQLQALLERVERATGWDSDIDKSMLRALGYTWRGMAYWHSNDRDMWKGPVFFTHSIDAAIALAERVSPGWIEVNGPRKYLNIPTPVPNHWRAEVSDWTGWGHTAPLAILAALLRALIAQSDEVAA